MELPLEQGGPLQRLLSRRDLIGGWFRVALIRKPLRLYGDIESHAAPAYDRSARRFSKDV
jgi:hypothetical protein